MDFDERLIRKIHVWAAIKRYSVLGPSAFRPARSAFLIYNGDKLPAKTIIRLAFAEVSGQIPPTESCTGGRASVRVLQDLGFNACYDAPVKRPSRNVIKCARRAAFVKRLQDRWGKVDLEFKVPTIAVPDLAERHAMPDDLASVLHAIESYRGMTVKGRSGHILAFDIYVKGVRRLIEFDERQHYTLPRAASLMAYKPSQRLAYDRQRWISLCQAIRAGDNSPAYRDEQRAFYDTIRDLRAIEYTGRPLLRVFEEDVLWERNDYDRALAERIIESVGTD